LNLKDIANAVKGGMWRYMGVERESDGLNNFLRQIRRWRDRVGQTEHRGPLEWQLENMLLVSDAMTLSALTRQESRGVHFRHDIPENRDEWLKHVELDVSNLTT
ncbi:MAG: L-aspartate oxidase, partial [Planctomycetota bacterium]